MIIVAYFLLQARHLRAEQALYSALNAAGAVLLLASLAYEPNTSAIVVEGFWLLISIFGLIRSFGAEGRPS